MPYIGKSPELGVRTRYYYTVSAGATSVSGNDDNSKSLTFSDGEYVDVYLNGVSLVAGTDYNTTTANTIAGLSAMSANDVVEVVVYDVFSVFSGDISGDLAVGGTVTVNSIIQTTTSDGDMVLKGNDGGSTITALTLDMSDAGKAIFNAGATFSSQVLVTTADNSAQLNLTSTDTDANNGPRLALQRDSGSPADDDILGNIEWYGENDASEAIEMGLIQVAARDVSDGTEDSALSIHTKVGGSRLNRCAFEPSKTLFNGNSADIDFVVEGDGESNLFYIDAGNDIILSGLNTPEATFATGIVPRFQIEGTGDTGSCMSITRNSNNDSAPHIFFVKTRGTSVNSDTAYAVNDYMGGFRWMGADGVDRRSELAFFMIQGDHSNPAENDTPGRIIIGTTPDGSAVAVERFRIAQDGTLTATDTSIGSNSDERLKKDITNYAYDLDTFKKYEVKQFNWKQPEVHMNKTNQIGFIAQDLQSVDSQWVDSYYINPKDEQGNDHPDAQYLDSDGMAFSSKLGESDAMYVSIIQQLITKIETLETKVKALEDA